MDYSMQNTDVALYKGHSAGLLNSWFKTLYLLRCFEHSNRWHPKRWMSNGIVHGKTEIQNRGQEMHKIKNI